ncbi:hypothetical protein BKA62DRAFT_685644 [Auriculariales sp. MPI-PUGE-AT-0066]|nr:hypothetical protein BKA62DRAFT_685644 [Auriculariales sp. MPI-PUGE-AT-0066]
MPPRANAASNQPAGMSFVTHPSYKLLDDAEDLYCNASPSNRMLLAMRSTIDHEIDWALNRLCRVSQASVLTDDKLPLLRLKSIPGLVDALFEWPEWYVESWDTVSANQSVFLSLDPLLTRKRKRALAATLILRNASSWDLNMPDLANLPRTRNLTHAALTRLDRSRDSNSEFILHIIDLLFHIGKGALVLPSSVTNPIPALEDIVATSHNRTLIIAAFNTLTLLLTADPKNSANLNPASPALEAALRYLPLFQDEPLLSAALEYLHVHLSNQAMVKAFLLHRELSATLRVLAALLVKEQIRVTVTVPLQPPAKPDPLELSPGQLQSLAVMEEPERCHEWMRLIFEASDEGDITQAEFWTLYQDTFRPFVAERPLLQPQEAIKSASPPQRYVMRGIARKAAPEPNADESECRWDQTRSSCGRPTFDSGAELNVHVREHIASLEPGSTQCPWSTCGRITQSPELLVRHIFTHLPPTQKPAPAPGQREFSQSVRRKDRSLFDIQTVPPPAPETTSIEIPPATSLTTLLILRSIFRTAFVSGEAAMRVDEEHFGFPGLVEEEVQEIEETPGVIESMQREIQGERRGRAAFVGIRETLATLQFADPILQDWVVEMADAIVGDVELDEDM